MDEDSMSKTIEPNWKHNKHNNDGDDNDDEDHDEDHDEEFDFMSYDFFDSFERDIDTRTVDLRFRSNVKNNNKVDYVFGLYNSTYEETTDAAGYVFGGSATGLSTGYDIITKSYQQHTKRIIKACKEHLKNCLNNLHK